jgi:putative hydrolase of the HAD superfamily
MRAVIFDFFGTLTDPAAEDGREALAHRTGELLGLSGPVFWHALSASFPDRITGAHGDTAATLAGLARACGADPPADQLARAIEHHRTGGEHLRRPRAEALEVLAELRKRGFRIGLMSDCGSELVETWAASVYAPLVDATVFSWAEGCRKPDPRLYAAAAGRLGADPGECWYVGDGGGRELSGAWRAGMRPVLVTNALVPGAARHRVDPDDFPDGLGPDAVPDLAALLPLLGRARVSPV